jgi:AraC family transcriptional regulator
MQTDPSEVGCPAMSVRYFACMADAWTEPRSAGFDLLLPAGKADALFVSLEREFCRRMATEPPDTHAPLFFNRLSTADPLLRGIGYALGCDFRAQRPPSATLLEAFAVAIAIHCARNPRDCESAVRGGTGLAPRKLEQVRSHIAQHLAAALLVEHLAAVVHMSPFHFARLFKLATGTSPHAYVTVQRVERAKELLRGGRMPLVEVAAAVGFQTQGHFTEVFHRVAGVTPRRFRLLAQNRKEPEELQQERG